MKIIFSWDDGAVEDQKLFELHNKHEIPGMFFVPTKNREGRKVISSEIIKHAESKYISFGGHTENHTYLTDISLIQAESEVYLNKEYLENILGHPITNFCLPGGKYNNSIIQLVYKYFKTIRTTDTMCFNYTGGLYKPTFHFYPRGVKSLIGNSLRNCSFKYLAYIGTHFKVSYFDLLETIMEKEVNSKDKNNVVMIWGHSWELEKYDLWDTLEKLMKHSFVKKYTVEYEDILNERSFDKKQ